MPPLSFGERQPFLHQRLFHHASNPTYYPVHDRIDHLRLYAYF